MSPVHESGREGEAGARRVTAPWWAPTGVSAKINTSLDVSDWVTGTHVLAEAGHMACSPQPSEASTLGEWGGP